MKDYSKCHCADFALDQSFIHWVQHPDPESDAFWASLAVSDRALGQEIEDARMIVQSMQFVEKELPETEVQALWNSILDHTRKKHVISHYWRVAVACAASVALIFGLWLWHNVEKQDDNLFKFAAKHIIQTNELNEVQIVLSDNTKYSTANNHVEIKYDDEGQLSVDSRKIVAQSAKTDKTEATGYNQVIVPWGKRTVISFADGTKLWLNAGSRAVYPIEFAKSSRELFIEGEAFFEVAKDENRPFIVKIGIIEVQVLGTCFNVNSYPQEGKTEVVLVNGSVQVVGRNRQVTLLQPDHIVEIDHTTEKQFVRQVDIYNYIGWKEGYLQFQNENPEVVLRKLERYYAIPVVIETEINRYTISGKLDLKENMAGTLDVIEGLVPIRYQFENDKVFIREK